MSPPPAAAPVVPENVVAVAPPGPRPAWLTPLIIVGLLIGAGGLAWYFIRRGPSNPAYDQGVVAFKEGRMEAAEGSFRKAATDVPNDPMPHVYLARLERDRGNLKNANAEAVKAVQLGPTSGPALRELASVLFAQQDYDGARKFYIRAVTADSSDRLSQGFLGCTMVRLGRLDEGARWIQRAGTGAWSACMPTPRQPGAQQTPGYGTPRP
jgi:tetratricopeptide (TPR) repeat protein